MSPTETPAEVVAAALSVGVEAVIRCGRAQAQFWPSRGPICEQVLAADERLEAVGLEIVSDCRDLEGSD